MSGHALTRLLQALPRAAILLLIWLALFLGGPARSPAERTVLVFIVDGLQAESAKAAAANGAENLKFLMENGVVVEEAYSTSPAPRMYMPDGSLPWGTSTSGNVAIHTGTHVFESRQMDDIFLAARRAGIKSVFAGGAANYKEFTTPDFTYYGSLSDTTVVRHGMEHFKKDGVRLLRLHLQQIRRGWRGPEGKTDSGSEYQKAILRADNLLGDLIRTFKAAGAWDSTYVIVSADHGMGVTAQSDHPPSARSSWAMYMNFYGPGIRRGSTIPYAETPDIAIMTAHFLNLKPLAGHTGPGVKAEPKGTTGTFLANIFEGGPKTVDHPKFIRRYLESRGWTPPEEYGDYRLGVLSLLREMSGR